MLAHRSVERLFAGMPEWWMANVMHQSQRFSQIDIQSERSGNGAGDLGNFQRVGEAVAEVVAVAAGEDLGFGFEAAKSAGMNDAVAVALEVVTVGMVGFSEAASAGVTDLRRVARQHEVSLAEAELSTQLSVPST